MHTFDFIIKLFFCPYSFNVCLILFFVNPNSICAFLWFHLMIWFTQIVLTIFVFLSIQSDWIQCCPFFLFFDCYVKNILEDGLYLILVMSGFLYICCLHYYYIKNIENNSCNKNNNLLPVLFQQEAFPIPGQLVL